MKERGELYEFGDFRLDVGERRLERLDGSTNGSLPEKAFQTLVHLVRFSGRLIEKDELLSAVWPDTIVEENNLGKAIHAIRRCLGDDLQAHQYIETVPKHGYRFVANVRRMEPATASETNGFAVPHTGHQNRSPAYELYLRGRVKAGVVRQDETEEAIQVLQEAITIDPSFAEAHALLARSFIRMAFNFSEGAARKRFLENAEVAIEGALDLQPDLAEGHFARGLLLWTHAKGFPHEQAIRSYKRSLRSNPHADETHHQLSMVYGHIGMLDEALDAVNRAIEINPNNTMARFRVSNYLSWQGKYSEALSVLKTVPRDVSPMLVDRVRAEALIHLGRTDEAEAIVDQYLKSHPDDVGGSFTSTKALVLALHGDDPGADSAIKRCSGMGRGFGHFHHTAYNIASAFAVLGETKKSLKWLEITADDGFPCVTYFEVDSNLDNLRRQPRYVELVASIKRELQAIKDAT